MLTTQAPNASASPPQSVSGSIGRFRWTICSLLFLATTLNYMDRQILGLLAPTLEKQLGWSETQYSNIVTAFQVAYALGLLGFGRLLDAVGVRRGYLLAVAVWGLSAMSHAMVKTVSGFGMARFALGLGEAGNFPSAIKAVSEWFPPRERALATGLFNSGANIGAVVAPLLVPWLTLHFGWQASFLMLGPVDIVWLLLWWRLYETPERSRRVSAAELAYIRSDPPLPSAKHARWRDILRYRQTWAFVVGMSFSAPIWWFFLFWLPKFLHKQYGLNLATLGLPLVLIYSMTCLGSVGGGWLSGFLLKRGWSVNAGRKTALLACALCVVPVIGAGSTSNLWLATVLLGLAAAAHQGWAANLFTLVSDLFPRELVGSVVGLGTMFGSLASILFAQTAGLLLQATGSYWSLFLIASGAYLTALGLMHILTPRMTPVKLEEPKHHP